MGRIILQMMISADGMISGPQGELDWIVDDEPLYRVHNENCILDAKEENHEKLHEK